jgi:hypothetical protein
MSPSIRASSDATSWAPSLLGESISLCGIASVNQLAAPGSTPQTRVTTSQSVSNYAEEVNLLAAQILGRINIALRATSINPTGKPSPRGSGSEIAQRSKKLAMRVLRPIT